MQIAKYYIKLDAQKVADLLFEVIGHFRNTRREAIYFM